MDKYIDKDALVAKIISAFENSDAPIDRLRASILARLLSLIDTLEVKEVDLDGERRKYLTEHFNVYEDGILQSKRSNLPLDTYDVIKIAKHFFELGLNTQHSSINIPNIDKILEESGIDPYSKEAKIFKESYYMVLEKLKEQKGEEL